MSFFFTVTEIGADAPRASRVITDIALGADGDLETSTGDLRLLPDLDAVVQNLSIRLRFFLGEWFLNLEEGIPYYEEILVKNPRTNTLRTIFSEAILSTPLVSALTDLSVVYDPAARSLSVSFDYVVTIDGNSTSLDYEKTFVLPSRGA